MVTQIKCEDFLEYAVNNNFDAILVPMSIYNSMNRGLAYDVALNFPQVKNGEKLTPYGDKRKYGKITEISTGFFKFIMCYVHTGGYNGGVFIDYDSLSSCLKEVNKKYSGKKVLSPIMGSTKYDGNGDIEKIVSIYNKFCIDADVYLCEYEQKDTKLEFFRQIASLRNEYKEKKIDSSEYKKRRSEIEWKRKHGFVTPMPEDYVYTPKGKKIG